MDDRIELEHSIASASERLTRLKRKALLESDPVSRTRLNRDTEALQRELFGYKKRLDALANTAPTPELDRPGFGLEPVDRPKVCISACRRDRSWVDRLQSHLEPLASQVISIDVWDETDFIPNSQWRDAFDRALGSAAVVVPMVTVDYLASRFVVDEELPMLLERARRGDLLVLPVIVGPSRFERTPLAQFPAANSPSSPLTGKSLVEQEAVLAKVARSIARHVGTSTVSHEGRSVL